MWVDADVPEQPQLPRAATITAVRGAASVAVEVAHLL
jgi:hypothetical protein